MTDRTLRQTADLRALRFDDRGLVPVVTQDAASGAVLMVAWANREALALSLDTGFMHYWSRSRKALWKKGETSGNLQTVRSLHADCDADTVLARVTMDGPACHTGEATCFGELPAGDAPDPAGAGSHADGSAGGSAVLDELWGVLQDRDRERPEGSWTTRLLSDENLRLKKLGEETVELVTALVRGDERASEEAADLVYHVMVALKGAGREWDEVLAELARRRR
ncbi:MAG: bifunctional phosphoribosyl-AMP cyclohydrolase/phosphoribosyl-ATP diphosphatase HisIE [Gemmatimonadales bacterium]|nr:MAG: bifunctional phosphoribosyl-AMP cyclohydrolase/phosphoribosyl-ATP diphosphatase HisIE [Gemmatimonadales bacterium]